MSDLSIAQSAHMLPIEQVAQKLGIAHHCLELYGHYKAKIDLNNLLSREPGKLILVTAMTPTPAGEGKTTVSVGLVDGLCKLGARACGALREPSLGPVFGMKGGAAGGGYSQVVPMEDINLHFTGDFAAIEKAHNLLSAMIDQRLHYSEKGGDNLDPRKIYWKRVIDMNDRTLRNITIGLGGAANGMPREDGFNITAASEVMAILCLSRNIRDLKQRLGNIFIGYTLNNNPVFARDIGVEGAMAVLLKDAMKPNLVQTLDNNPVLIHGGPFANIADGANSILATDAAMRMADYAVTEAGFGSDLGAEKFFNIKARVAGISPSAVVLVVTVRALKYHGCGELREGEDLQALKQGLPNMIRHINIMQQFGVPVVVAINRFTLDTDDEIALVREVALKHAGACEESDGWHKGADGMTALAATVKSVADKHSTPHTPLYDWQGTIEEKIQTIATRMYGARQVEYTPKARKDIEMINALGFSQLPICMAKTQNSLSDDPALKGVPEDFTLSIREVELASGSGFIIPIAGHIMRMPGLPKKPAALNINIDDEGHISGLF